MDDHTGPEDDYRYIDIESVETLNMGHIPVYKLSATLLNKKMMWETKTIWFEIAMVSILFLLGHIFLGHFEERSPKWRKLLKYIATLTIIIAISVFAGRIYALAVLVLSLIPVIYIHAVILPRKGINGWTGEPKSKYYDFRGWDKNIFNKSC